jgi:hypothetical protein
MNWEDEDRLKVIDKKTGKRFDVSPKAFKDLYLVHGNRIQLDGTEGANNEFAHFANFGRKKARKIEPESIDASNYNSYGLSSPIEPAFKSVPTGRGAPAYQPRSTGRGVPSHQPVSTGRGAPAYQPVSTGRGVPAYQPVSTGRGAVPTRETSPVRGYNGHTGDTRGVQGNWWDGRDMGQEMNYMDQFPQIDGSDNSMREYMMGRKDMSGTIYDPTPSNFVPSAILDKPYSPSSPPQAEQPQNYTPWQSLMDIGSSAKDALSEGYNLFKGNVQDYRQDRSFPSQSIPSLPNIWDTFTDYGSRAVDVAGMIPDLFTETMHGLNPFNVQKYPSMGADISQEEWIKQEIPKFIARHGKPPEAKDIEWLKQQYMRLKRNNAL